MRRFIKIFLTAVVLVILIFQGTVSYLKYSARDSITDKVFTDLVKTINSARALPDTFKKTYTRLYPAIFTDNFTVKTFKSALGRTDLQSPSRQVANRCWHLLSDDESRFINKLDYLGLILLIEDETTQEKCFEYFVSRYDFTNNAIGIDQASREFYHKPVDSLSLDEQLGLVLKLRNAAYFNSRRYPERCDSAVRRLREIIAGPKRILAQGQD